MNAQKPGQPFVSQSLASSIASGDNLGLRRLEPFRTGPELAEVVSPALHGSESNNFDDELRLPPIHTELQRPIRVDHEESLGAVTESVSEMNHRTQGIEYYGPGGVFSFLLRLRSKAGSHNYPSVYRARDADSDAGILQSLSIVNFLHGHECEMGSSNEARQDVSDEGIHAPTLSAYGPHRSSRSPQATPDQQHQFRTILAPSVNPQISHDRLDRESEKEIMRLYFRNLHLIHPVLYEAEFFSRCIHEFWSSRGNVPPRSTHSKRIFFALACMVVALGAITAGEDIVPETAVQGSARSRSILPTLRLAKIYFEKAKDNIGDIFETCSLESTQTLFLMSIFCQNALRPHSCYMYSGVAVRTAFAMGLPNVKERQSPSQFHLWWAIYSHEIEMCTSAGRESALRSASSHSIQIPLKVAEEDSPYDIIRFMVPLAGILHQVSEEVYHPQGLVTPGNALELNRRLEDWKNQLPPAWTMEALTLTEPEWMTKQKIVLKLRFLNAKILIHRPFLNTAGTGKGQTAITEHIQSCVDASRQTIELLYEAYMHRPYFRTWWYNTTYLLYASLTLLYVVILNIYAQNCDTLLHDVERSVKILRVMDRITIAKRCEQIISEVLDTAKKLHQHRSQLSINVPTSTAAPTVSAEGTTEFDLIDWPDLGPSFPFDSELHLSQDDLFAGLVDINVFDDLIGFEDLFAEMPSV